MQGRKRGILAHRRFVVFAFLLLWGAALGFTRLPDMVPGTEDVPLPSEMTLWADPVHFEVPNGRLVVLQGHSPSSFQLILDFYKKTLPKLGWVLARKRPGTQEWSREGELLKIKAQSQKNGCTFSLEISPQD